MFITQLQAEQPMPKSLIHPGEQYWRAVSLSIESPLYLLVYVQTEADIRLRQTALIAFESDLVEIINSLQQEDIEAIARLTPSQNNESPWVLQWVESLWLPKPIEAQQLGPFVARYIGESDIRDTNFNSVNFSDERVLVFKVKTT